MIRLFVDMPLASGQPVSLAPHQAHYVNQVMRLGRGDSLLLFNGRDGEFEGTLLDGRKKTAHVMVDARKRPQLGCPDLWLCFAPIKKQRLDFIIEKATEIGVSRLSPVMTQRTIVGRVNTERLEAQVIEAAEQCERLDLPEVKDPVTLNDLVSSWPEDRILYLLDESGGAPPINKVLQNADAKALSAFIVGPEGGFDPSELDLLAKLPFVRRLSIGPRILRADTACLAALSCWQAVLGDWQQELTRQI